jgi:hypothetical protein
LARDFQSIQQTKKVIASLENKLQLAQQLQPSSPTANDDEQH